MDYTVSSNVVLTVKMAFPVKNLQDTVYLVVHLDLLVTFVIKVPQTDEFVYTSHCTY